MITRVVSWRGVGWCLAADWRLQLVEKLRDAVLVAIRADAAGVRPRRRDPEIHEESRRVHADVLSRDGLHRPR